MQGAASHQPEMSEQQKFMEVENLPPTPAQQQPEESDVPLMLPGLMHGDSISRSLDFPLPLLRGDSLFSNITPEELLQGNNLLGGMSRQPSITGRPLAGGHQEEQKREEPMSFQPGSPAGPPAGPTNLSPKTEEKHETEPANR